MYIALCISNNKCVDICSKLALNGSRSPTANSITYVCFKYGLNKYTALSQNKRIITKAICNYTTLHSQDTPTAGSIRDFILLKENFQKSGQHDQVKNVGDIIELLCTVWLFKLSIELTNLMSQWYKILIFFVRHNEC